MLKRKRTCVVMPCYKYKFQHLSMPCNFSPCLNTVLLPELVELCFRYAFQFDTLDAHRNAVALLHAQRRSLEQMMFQTRRQHAMWRNCTRHSVSWEDSMHKTTMSLLRRADEFLKRAVKYLPDPVKIVYREPVIYHQEPAPPYQGPIMPEDVNYFF